MTNRALLKEFCTQNNLLVKNTFIQKAPAQQVTYVDMTQPNKLAPPLDPRTKLPARHPTAPYNQHFAQLDLALVHRHWAPSITNIESKRGDFVYWTRHFPVHIEIRLRLSAQRKHSTRKRKDPTLLNSTKEAKHRLAAKEAMFAALLAQDTDTTVEEMWKTLAHAAHAGLSTLPDPEQTPKQPYTTSYTLKLIAQRNDAERRGKPGQAKALQKAVKRSVRRDKRAYLTDILKSGDWNVVKRHKKAFEPRTHRLTDATGKLVGTSQTAETQAQYYSAHQWNAPPPQPPAPARPALFPVSPAIPTGDFSGEELNAVLKTLKTRKAPGPDAIPNEIWKMLLKTDKSDEHKDRETELNQRIREYFLKLINKIHHEKVIPDSWNDANIAALFKGGNSADPDRYRPIALLATAYKVYTRLIHQRLVQGLEERLRETQYGFRPKRSAPEAIALLLRTLDIALSNKHDAELHVILLDWVKAFDKVTHTGLLDSLQRLGLPADLLDSIKMLYTSPRFRVTNSFGTSQTYTQHTGIRQGCPLSPYLFVAWMTVMMHDATEEFFTQYPLHVPAPAHQPLNTRISSLNPFPTNDIAYADDLTLIARFAGMAQNLLKYIETRAGEDNMRLNASKTLHLQFRGPAHTITTSNGTALRKLTQARLLGTQVTTGSPKDRARAAITARLADARAAYQSLHQIWKHANIPLKRKLNIYRACVVQKLVYGLYTHVIAKADMDRLESFHTQCLRKIQGIKTTHAAKNILFTPPVPNDEVLRRAKAVPLRVEFENQQALLYAHVYRRPNAHPARRLLFENNTFTEAKWRGKRAAGRPLTTWAQKILPVIKQLYQFDNGGQDGNDLQLRRFMSQDTREETAAARIRRLTETRRHLAAEAVQVKQDLTSYYTNFTQKATAILNLAPPGPDRHAKDYNTPPNMPEITGPPPPPWWPPHATDFRPKPPPKAPAPMTKQTTIYTDGAGPSGNKPSTKCTPAGWGFVAMDTHVRHESAGAVITDPQHARWLGAQIGSNNTGELTAILEGAVWAYHTPTVREVEFRYDSKYAAKLAAGEWEPTANLLLVKAVRLAIKHLESRTHVSFAHVKAHTGELWNERADALAGSGLRKFRPPP